MISEFSESEIFIFVGHFGSGKTEVAANFTFQVKKHFDKVNIIDLDIVNPFFRTEDLKQKFIDQGVNVILPQFVGTNVEMPAISSDISMALQKNDFKTIVDIGGDDIGAKIISTLREYILAKKYKIYCVVNTYRPFTDSAQKIINMVAQIEKSSRMKVDGIINNTNLANETLPVDIVKGQKIIEDAAKYLGIPVSFICVNEDIEQDVQKLLPEKLLIHKIKVDLPWN